MTKIRLLVAHRHEHYDGEFAPEVLAVVDEWTLDDNPQYWIDLVKKEKSTQGSDVAAWAEVEIELNGDDLMSALYPLVPIGQGPIVPVAPISEEY